MTDREAFEEGRCNGYTAAEGNEFLFEDDFEDEDEFLDNFMEFGFEAEEAIRESNGLIVPSSVWELYETGVRIGIKKRFEEIMEMFVSD